MRWVLVAVMALVALPAIPAAACPPGRPCLKYRKRVPAERHEVPDRYMRVAKGGAPGFDRKRVARFLLGSAWRPVYDKPVPPEGKVAGATKIIRETDALRFVDPSSTVPEAKPGERIVLVRYIEKNKGHTLVDVDGEIFALAACKTRKGYACLTISDIGFAEADPDHPIAPVFAQPPEP